MPTSELSITQAAASDMSNVVKNAAVASMQVDSAGSQEETTWENADWSKQWGYFNTIPELKSAIIMKAIWAVGKGYIADPETSVILDHISGWWKDTFDDILFNMEIIKSIGGDAYAEIIRGDDKAKTIINLKPLDPGSMRVV